MQLELIDLHDVALRMQIDRFCDLSPNATIFHFPQFLAYHGLEKLVQNKVELRGIVGLKNEEIQLYLPVALIKQTQKRIVVNSCWGASYGGLVVGKNYKLAQIKEFCQALGELLSQYDEVVIRLPPPPFDPFGIQAAFAFYLQEVKLVPLSYEICLSLTLQGEQSYKSDVQRRLRKAREAALLTVKESGDVNGFYQVLMENMLQVGSTPTHSLEELRDLRRRFPQRIRFWLAYHEESVCAGVCVFLVTSGAATTFYQCALASARKWNALHMVLDTCAQQLRREGLSWLDLGPSSFGTSENCGLVHFKEQFGAIANLRTTVGLTQ